MSDFLDNLAEPAGAGSSSHSITTEKARECALAFGLNVLGALLDLLDSDGLRTLGSGFYFESNFFSLAQRSKTLRHDSGVMDEYVTLVLSLNETITLFVIEPLHATFRHFNNPFLLAVFPCEPVGLL